MTRFVAVKKSSLTFGVGITLIIVGAVAIVAVVASGGTALPLIGALATTVGGVTTLTTAGTVTLSLGTLAAGTGLSIVFGNTPEGYEKGAEIGKTVSDVNIGSEVQTVSLPAFSEIHPCPN